MMNIPTRLLPHRAPIAASIRSIHPVAKQTRNDHPQRLDLGQTPLGGKIPALFLRFLRLLGSLHSFDLGANQCRQHLGRHQNRGNGNYRHFSNAIRQLFAASFRCDQGLVHPKGRHV